MAEVCVPWGSRELTLTLPEPWTLQQVAAPALRSAPPDWSDRLALALTSGDCPLAKLLAARRGGRVALIVEDMTRHSPLPQILPLILREIRHAKIGDDQVELVFANGMHPPMTPEQAQAKLGDLASTLRWRSNNWQDRGAHVSVGRVGGVDIRVDRGVAQADLRIIVSSVSPHLQAGFGGGYKMIFPGVAALETIRGLHRLGISRRPRQLVGTDEQSNAMRQAIDAAGQLLDDYHGRSYAVQYLLDDKDLPAYVAAGDVLPSFRMMAKQCSVACGVVVNERADVVISNAYPRDFDLWQSFKGIANALWAARPQGVVICLTRCEAGVDAMKVPKWNVSPQWTRRVLRWLGAESLSSLLMRVAPSLAGDAAFFVRMAMQALYRNPILIVSPSLAQTQVRFPGLRIFSDAAEAFAAAQDILGPGPQRVVVFPSGGATYPIPPAPRRA